MFTKTAIVALFAGLVAGQATPKGEPSGNPITRPLNEIVPACEPFTITWQPTTSNSVSMILLKGPATNVIPIGAPLAVGISNSGSLAWTPASSLEATEGNTGYGLQIIDDVTGQYQYSTQFGISKGPACNSYVTPTPSSTGYGGGYPVSTGSAFSSALSSISSELHSHLSDAWSSATANATTIVTKTSAHTAPVLSTGFPAGNSSVIQPSGSMSVPSSLKPTGSATRSPLPEVTTAGAAGLKAGLGMVGAAAAFAFML